MLIISNFCPTQSLQLLWRSYSPDFRCTSLATLGTIPIKDAFWRVFKRHRMQHLYISPSRLQRPHWKKFLLFNDSLTPSLPPKYHPHKVWDGVTRCPKGRYFGALSLFGVVYRVYPASFVPFSCIWCDIREILKEYITFVLLSYQLITSWMYPNYLPEATTFLPPLYSLVFVQRRHQAAVLGEGTGDSSTRHIKMLI